MIAWVSDVGVGVPAQPELVGDLDAAEDQRPARDEAVAVVADPDRAGAHPSGSIRRSRPSKTQISSIPSVAHELDAPDRRRSRGARARGRRRRA